MIRVAVVGAAGRMGRALIEAVDKAEGMLLGAATEQSESSLLGRDAGEVAGLGPCGVRIVGDLSEVVDDFDLVIDFTRPEATLRHLALCRGKNKRMVIGTTGFSQLWGLGFWAGTAYGFSANGDLLSIDLATGAGASIPLPNIHAGLSFWGAGTTTAAPVEPPR